MVFSQTSQKTHSILKVVELNRSKSGKSQEIDGLSGVIPKVDTQPGPSRAADLTSPNISMEEFLKTEPEEFETMYHTDCEFFQDLGLWCSAPAKDERAQTTDSSTNYIDLKTNNIDTTNTVPAPLPRLGLEAASPATASLYPATPTISPIDGFFKHDKFFYPELGSESTANFQEQFLDIASLPVVIEELPSGADWTDTLHTPHTDTNAQHKTPFIDQEDSLDLKLSATVEMRQVEGAPRRPLALRLPPAPAPAPALALSTPDVLRYVEQLEETTALSAQGILWPTDETTLPSLDSSKASSPAFVDYEPITPKTESHIESDDDSRSLVSRRRRRHSEDSDETYTPHADRAPAKRSRRGRPAVPIKEMIQALEHAQPRTRARRGRPPKRRDSSVSAGTAAPDCKYREVRDKNNEASKRSRMNRKLKELQMEQLAIDLEERNKKLKVKADILEDMTKRLKDALMTAILKQ